MKQRLLMLLIACYITVAGVAQEKPKTGLGKILNKADTLLKKVDEKINSLITPPKNLTPVDGYVLTAKDAKEPIAFSWSPVSPLPKGAVIYRLHLFEVKKGQSPEEAARTNKVFEEKTVQNETNLSCCINPVIVWPIAMDSKYGWNITVLDAQGKFLAASQVTVFSTGEGSDIDITNENVSCKNAAGSYPFTFKLINNNSYARNFNSLSVYSINGVVQGAYPGYLPITSVSPPFGSSITPGSSLTITGTFPYTGTVNQIVFTGNTIGGIPPQTASFTFSDSLSCNTDCCLSSQIGDVLVKNSSGTQVFSFNMKTCKNTPFIISEASKLCNQPFTLSASAACPPGCRPKVTYKLLSNSGAVVLTNNNTLIIPASLANGAYTLTVDFYCGDKLCKSCKFDIRKDCSPATCCDKINYKEPVVLDAAGNIVFNFQNSNTFIIDPIKKNCNQDFFIRTSMNCGTENCPPQVLYKLKRYSTGVITTASSILNFPAAMPNDLYYLNIWLICGKDTCKQLEYTIRKSCVDIPTDCCIGGSWGEKLRVNDNGTTSRLDACGSKLGAASCGYSGKLSVKYNCNPLCNTSAQIIYQFYNTSTNAPVGPSVTVSSGAIATVTNPTISGSYYLKISAKCGDKICDECSLYFTLDCKPVDCCKGGIWDKKYFKNQLINCNTSLPSAVSLPVNSLQTVNYKYICNPAYPEQCQATIRYIFKNSAGVQVGTVSTAPSGVNGQVRMPATAGSYCLWAYAYCGESQTACDSCKICFNVTCENCEGVNVNCNMNSRAFTLNGNITSPATRLIKKVIIELADISARNSSSGSPVPPVPNFEFVPAGTSINGPVLFKHSLYGTRSNIIESNFTTPSSNISYTLKISDDTGKEMLRYRIKLTIIFNDGSYCELVKTNITD